MASVKGYTYTNRKGKRVTVRPHVRASRGGSGSLGFLSHSTPRRSRLRSYSQLGGGGITSAKFWLSSGHSPAQAAHKVRSGESGMKKKVATARKKYPHLSESQIRQDLHRYGHVAKWR